MEALPARRKIERNHLAQFMRICDAFPQGNYNFDDKPDLLVHTEDGVLGVEHTQIFRLQNSVVKLQGQEKYQEQIVARAHQIHEDRSDSLFSVSVLFDPHAVLKKADVDKAAIRLADLVVELNLSVGQGGWLQGWVYELSTSRKFPAGVSELFVERVDKQGLSLWAAGGGGTVPELTSKRFQEELDAKEPKVGNYRSRCNKVWLLLVTDRGKPSSWFDFPSNIFDHTYQSGFDRVFHLDVFLNRVVELNVCQPLAPASGGGCA